MAVSVSDPHSPGKRNRFVGICIARGSCGLKAFFILRNVVDGLGVEVMYRMYSPTVLSIEVLKLEKRLDEELYYLRNCPLEFSTFDFNMEPVSLPQDSPVPINPLKVTLNPRPWEYRWERFNLKGIEPIAMTEIMIKGKEKNEKPWTTHDMMLEYRQKVNDEEEERIMAEVYKEKQIIDSKRKITRVTVKRKK